MAKLGRLEYVEVSGRSRGGFTMRNRIRAGQRKVSDKTAQTSDLADDIDKPTTVIIGLITQIIGEATEVIPTTDFDVIAEMPVNACQSSEIGGL